MGAPLRRIAFPHIAICLFSGHRFIRDKMLLRARSNSSDIDGGRIF
jgi:hypothetical protein